MRSRINVAVSKKRSELARSFSATKSVGGDHGNGDKIVDCFGLFELNSPPNSARPPELSL